MKRFNLTLIVLTIFSLVSCNQLKSLPVEKTQPNIPLLKDVYQGLFNLGVAINQNQATKKDLKSAAIAAQHFAVLTSENDMKWESIQPTENQFTWQGADALIEFASSNDQAVIGHTLVWHSQTPDWVFESSKGVPASRELLLQRMQTRGSAACATRKRTTRSIASTGLHEAHHLPTSMLFCFSISHTTIGSSRSSASNGRVLVGAHRPQHLDPEHTKQRLDHRPLLHGGRPARHLRTPPVQGGA